MNKIILAVVLSCAAAAMPRHLPAVETNATTEATVTEVISEGMKFLEENGWNAADVADAIKSLRGLYVRDNATKEGRKRWNGKIVSTTIDTNTWTRTTVYENGRIFVDKAEGRNPAESVKSSNARLTTVVSNGVPAALARARARRAAEVNNGPTNVTVTVTTGAQ